MPNIKSAIKRVKVTAKKNQENKSAKTQINTFTKKFKTLLQEGKIAEAEKFLCEVISVIDKAASDNVIHKNSADRKKAALGSLLSQAKKS